MNEVEKFLSSSPDVSFEVFSRVDELLENLSSQPPRMYINFAKNLCLQFVLLFRQDILSLGSPWGALESRAKGEISVHVKLKH